MNIFFVDENHRQALLAQLVNLNQICQDSGRCDPYYLSALYILTSTKEFRVKSVPFIKNGIDFEKISRNDFSSGYRRLFNIAWNLFNYGKKNLDIADALDILDNTHYKIMMTGISLRREQVFVNDLVYNIKAAEGGDAS